MLTARPEITWQFLLELERPTREAIPNRGHRVIAEMEGYFDAVWTLTQNVDGLHRRAGSRQVVDVHGDLHDLACTRCDHGERVPDYAGLDLPPRCPRCQGPLRPGVVLFGEELPEEKLARLWSEFEAGFDLVFSIGTSSLFPYIAAPVLLARESGIPTVEINPESTAVTSRVDVKIAGGAAEVLDRIWRQFLAR
jgi:NAD-dependent deacetylase